MNGHATSVRRALQDLLEGYEPLDYDRVSERTYLVGYLAQFNGYDCDALEVGRAARIAWSTAIADSGQGELANRSLQIAVEAPYALGFAHRLGWVQAPTSLEYETEDFATHRWEFGAGEALELHCSNEAERAAIWKAANRRLSARTPSVQ